MNYGQKNPQNIRIPRYQFLDVADRAPIIGDIETKWPLFFELE